MWLMQLHNWGCVAAPDSVSAGVYQTWDDIVNRCLGKAKTDLFLALGPPQFHNEADDGMEELFWDMTLGVGVLNPRPVASPSSVVE
mgnify:CR=1 FL=1